MFSNPTSPRLTSVGELDAAHAGWPKSDKSGAIMEDPSSDTVT